MTSGAGPEDETPSFGDYDEEAPTEVDAARKRSPPPRKTRIVVAETETTHARPASSVPRKAPSATGGSVPPDSSSTSGRSDLRVALWLGGGLVVFTTLLLVWVAGSSANIAATDPAVTAAASAPLVVERPKRRRVVAPQETGRSIPDLQRAIGGSYKLSQCGRQAREASQDLSGGRTQWVSVAVDGSGRAVEVSMQDAARQGGALHRCVQDAMTEVRFPEGTVTQTVRIPITF